MEIMSEGSVGRLLIPANYVGCLSANQMTGTFLLPAPHSAPVHQCSADDASAVCGAERSSLSAVFSSEVKTQESLH